MAPALAHQRTVRIRQVDLRLRLRRCRRRGDVSALARSRTPLPRRHLALVLRSLRVRTRLRPPFQFRARTVQLRPQRLPPRQLLRQTLRIRRVVRVGLLRLIQQPLDLDSQLLAQRPRPVVAEAVALVRVRVHLRAVHAHRPNTQQLQLLRQQQYLQERRRHRIEVAAPERADRVVVRMTVRRHVPNANVPIRRPLDPTRAEDPVRVAVHQQRQHHPRVILRRPGRQGRGHRNESGGERHQRPELEVPERAAAGRRPQDAPAAQRREGRQPAGHGGRSVARLRPRAEEELTDAAVERPQADAGRRDGDPDRRNRPFRRT